MRFFGHFREFLILSFFADISMGHKKQVKSMSDQITSSVQIITETCEFLVVKYWDHYGERYLTFELQKE